MSKRITIILSPAAEKFFYLVMAGLEVPDGKGLTKPCNQSQAISHCLEELALFEEFTEDQLTNWLHTNYPEKYKAYRDSLPAELKAETYELPSIEEMIAQIGVNPHGEFVPDAIVLLQKTIASNNVDSVSLLFLAASGREKEYLSLAKAKFPDSWHGKMYSVQSEAFILKPAQ